MLLQLAVTAGKRAFRRRALRRPHPARMMVTCGDTDMDWPRLGASTTYDWTLGQILPRSREEDHQQNLTEALSKRRHRFMYMRNALTGHSNAKAGSASSEGSACRFTT